MVSYGELRRVENQDKNSNSIDSQKNVPSVKNVMMNEHPQPGFHMLYSPYGYYFLISTLISFLKVSNLDLIFALLVFFLLLRELLFHANRPSYFWCYPLD